MPNTKSLAEQANAEIGQAAYERESHEMRNESKDEAGGNEDLEKGAYEHKPISRGSSHRK